MSGWDTLNAQVGGKTTAKTSGWDSLNASAKPQKLKNLQFEAQQAAVQSKKMNSIGGLLKNTLIGIPKATGIGDAAKAGWNQLKTGFGQTVAPQSTLTQRGEGLLNLGAGTINTAFSPLAPITTPVGKSIQFAGDQLAKTPYMQNYGNDVSNLPSEDRAPERILEAIVNALTIAGTVAPLAPKGIRFTNPQIKLPVQSNSVSNNVPITRINKLQVQSKTPESTPVNVRTPYTASNKLPVIDFGESAPKSVDTLPVMNYDSLFPKAAYTKSGKVSVTGESKTETVPIKDKANIYYQPAESLPVIEAGKGAKSNLPVVQTESNPTKVRGEFEYVKEKPIKAEKTPLLGKTNQIEKTKPVLSKEKQVKKPKPQQNKDTQKSTEVDKSQLQEPGITTNPARMKEVLKTKEGAAQVESNYQRQLEDANNRITEAGIENARTSDIMARKDAADALNTIRDIKNDLPSRQELSSPKVTKPEPPLRYVPIKETINTVKTNSYGKPIKTSALSKPAAEKAPLLSKPTGKPDTVRITPIKGTGVTKTRGLSLGVEAKAIEKRLTNKLGNLPEYETVSMKDQAQHASRLINEDYQNARSIALGEKAPPRGVLPESVFVAIEDLAIKEGDVATLQDLANSKLTSQATTMGQRIRTLGERDPDSPVEAIQEVQKARQEAIANRTDIKKEKANTVSEIETHLKKNVPKKEDWNSFLDSITC